MEPFKVEQWEIWYTFSTYIEAHISNLEKVAKALVDLELSECCMLSNGLTFCKTEEGVASGETSLKLSADLKQTSAEFVTYPNVEMSPFAKETWLVGVQFIYGEARQISRGRELPSLHLRAFLNPIALFKREERISYLYPMIVLYETGILLVEFRIISPENSVSLNEFIENYVNIQQHEYDYAFVSSMISALAPEVYQYYSKPRANIFDRIQVLRKRRKQKILLDKVTKEIDIGDFTFELTPLPRTDDTETITSVALTLFTIIGYLSKQPDTSYNFLFKGFPDLPDVANFWSGRPHVHMFKHSNQASTSSKNEEVNKSIFGQILARIPTIQGDCSVYVPADARPFEDYSAYIISAGSLWVWSADGMKHQQQWMDVNRGNLVYEHQVQVELLEYGYMLHKALIEKSMKVKNYPELLSTRKDLVELKSRMLES